VGSNLQGLITHLYMNMFCIIACIRCYDEKGITNIAQVSEVQYYSATAKYYSQH
jgi:hypothetical protein